MDENLLVQCNIVVTPKSRKMGLLLLFYIKDKIFKKKLVATPKFALRLELLRAVLSLLHSR